MPKAALKATNASGYYIAYKVKTTKPKRYVVRPPQGIVLPEQGAEIMLTMVPGDANALWHEANERARLSGTPHRPPVVGRFCGGVCLLACLLACFYFWWGGEFCSILISAILRHSHNHKPPPNPPTHPLQRGTSRATTSSSCKWR